MATQFNVKKYANGEVYIHFNQFKEWLIKYREQLKEDKYNIAGDNDWMIVQAIIDCMDQAKPYNNKNEIVEIAEPISPIDLSWLEQQ